MNGPTRREFLKTTAATLAAGSVCSTAGASAPADDFQVGAYYFPNYHVDPRNERQFGRGWTEWELTKAARPRFAGHHQPRVPAWGYQDEADPAVMEKKIDVAADHGLDYWIFDWYWFNDGPFLDRCLEEGYFGAANNSRLKFCCMWANHDYTDIFPYTRGRPRKVLYPGVVTPKTFERIVEHVIRRYFSHPAHLKIDGRPYFSFYDLTRLLENFGSLEKTRLALDEFRQKTVAAGFAGLHLNAVAWGQPVLPDSGKPISPAELVRRLGFDSVTSYVWMHHYQLPDLETDYTQAQQGYFDYWARAEKMFDVPYYPNVSVGWDSSPRTNQADDYGSFGYPFTNTMSGNTPQRFRQALQATKRRLQSRPNGPRILNINSWNEWTEGSYLEPDMKHGLQYLEAIKEVFGSS